MGFKDMRVTNDVATTEKPTRLYLIEFEDDTGYYIKCGKSSGSSSDERLIYIITSYVKLSGGCCPYAKILRDVEVTEVFDREHEFHTKFASRRHYPEHAISGYTEMFSIDKEEALEAFDRILDMTFERTNTTKTCSKCGQTKSTIYYYTMKSSKDGLKNECKACTIEYSRSHAALPSRMYRNQVEHSRYRGHPRPLYTLEEFKQWVLQHPNYDKLYEQYKSSGYDKELVPSVDRLDSSRGYSFDNIQLITFKENRLLRAQEAIQEQSVPVLIAAASSGKIIGEFTSGVEACKVLGISNKQVYSKIDTVTAYGWLATIDSYQILYKTSRNRFTDNGYIKNKYRYTLK